MRKQNKDYHLQYTLSFNLLNALFFVQFIPQ
jgi:hypothetical protein